MTQEPMLTMERVNQALRALTATALTADLEATQRNWKRAQAMRGAAMSDALQELKVKLGRRPTIYEVQRKADELQIMWHWGIPLCSERHPVEIKVVVNPPASSLWRQRPADAV